MIFKRAYIEGEFNLISFINFYVIPPIVFVGIGILIWRNL